MRPSPTSRPRWRATSATSWSSTTCASRRGHRGGALVDAGPARRRRRDADLAGLSQPPAPRHALRRRAVGRGLACGLSRARRPRHRAAARGRIVRLPPAVSGADAYRHAGRGAARRTAHRGRGRRGARPRPRPAARLHVGVRRHRPRRHPAALDVPGQRDRFALEPRLAALRRASVPRAPGRQPGLPHLVRRRPAHRRHRRPDAAQGGRPLHPRAGERPARAAEQRRRPRRARPDLPDRPARRLRHPGASGDSESKGAAPADRPFVRGGERTGR